MDKSAAGVTREVFLNLPLAIVSTPCQNSCGDAIATALLRDLTEKADHRPGK
ncbi:MAG: hypothetical protein Q4B12_02625 [Bowdeniella nasicola]|nr:hypothetical protein [Bowdeniella nasicola]